MWKLENYQGKLIFSHNLYKIKAKKYSIWQYKFYYWYSMTSVCKLMLNIGHFWNFSQILHSDAQNVGSQNLDCWLLKSTCIKDKTLFFLLYVIWIKLIEWSIKYEFQTIYLFSFSVSGSLNTSQIIGSPNFRQIASIYSDIILAVMRYIISADNAIFTYREYKNKRKCLITSECRNASAWNFISLVGVTMSLNYILFE